MKVTNDMIDKVTEVCFDVARQTDTYYEDALRAFLRDYLFVPAFSLLDSAVRLAKEIRTQDEWRDAYRRYCLTVYGEEVGED